MYHLNTFGHLTIEKNWILATTLWHASNIHEILIFKFPLFGAHSLNTSFFLNFECRVDYYSFFFFTFRHFRKIAKPTISFIMAVSPSVRSPACLPARTDQFGSLWTNFHGIWYYSVFRQSVEKCLVLLWSETSPLCWIRIIKWQNTVKTQLYLLAMSGWIT